MAELSRGQTVDTASCSDSRSAQARRLLQRAGFAHVADLADLADLAGGMPRRRARGPRAVQKRLTRPATARAGLELPRSAPIIRLLALNRVEC